MSTFSLQQLGWRHFHTQQLTLEDFDAHYPARIASVHRSGVIALCEQGRVEVVVPRDVQRSGVAAVLTVGDWILIERATFRLARRLERQSAIMRVAAGSETQRQAVAANLDTLFIVTSCNHDFNPSRLERYLAVAVDAGVEPVIVLTKADLCGDASGYVSASRSMTRRAEVIALNATLPTASALLDAWLEPGQTVAFVGSSGVGKSTLVNSLIQDAAQTTAAIREDDSRGRHTTTARQLFPTTSGAWLIDTPGMRELRIGAVEAGVESVFDDLAELARQCAFRDCRHGAHQGCALQSAVDAGVVDKRRLGNYLKLQREAVRAARTLHEQRDSERRMGKLYKGIQERRRRDRGQ